MKQLIMIVFFLLPSFLFAQKREKIADEFLQSAIVLSSQSIDELDISSSFEVLTETKEHYSFAQITSGVYDTLFSKVINHNKNETSYDRYLWARLNIASNINQNTLWILKTDKLLSEVTAYIVHQDGKTDTQKSGWSVPPSGRGIVDPDVIFLLSLKEKENTTIYLHIHANLRWSTIDNLNVKLIPEAHWNNSKLKNYNFLSLYAGFCLLAIFYWVINYFLSGKVNYIFLIFTTLFALIFCLDIYGVTAIFWPDYPWYFLVKYGQNYLWFPLLIVSHFIIGYKVISIRTNFPGPVVIFFWLCCVVIILCLFISPLFLQWKYSHTISLLMILLLGMVHWVLLAIYLMFKRGFRAHGFSLLAALPLFSGMSCFIFTSLGYLHENYKILAPVGSLLIVIIYFYGMVHYVKVLRDKRKKEILKNEQLVLRQNIILEKTVEERTAELKVSNKDLSVAIQDLKHTHEQLIEAEKLKANEQINTLLKEQELKSVNDMLDVQEGERRRIASDLHDRLGSMLSTVKLYFGTVEEQIDTLKEQNKEQYYKANSLLDEACEEVRKISHDLVSGELVKFGLVSALRQMAETIEDTGQLKIKVLAFGMDSRLDSNVEIALYRVIQELMNNILKHARSTEVTIQLTKLDNNLNIMVEDNGIGFDLDAVKLKDGIGLKNMETRVNKLNGKIHFDSGKGKGTTTIIDITA